MRNGIIDYKLYINMIQECAYFLWMNGNSDDPTMNWIKAEQKINEQLKR